VKPDREQKEDGDGGKDDRQDGELDRLPRYGRADLENLPDVDRSELGGKIVLDDLLLRRQHRPSTDDEAAAACLDDRAVDRLTVNRLRRDRLLNLCDGWMACEGDGEFSASGKVDPKQEPPGRHGDHAGDDDQQRDREEEVAPADDVEPSHSGWLGFDRVARSGTDVRGLASLRDVRHFGHGRLP
jgi:hypothetical protein